MKCLNKISLGLIILVLFSCQTNTGTGIIAGAAIGAGIGAVTGGNQGALIGSATGVFLGGLAGAGLDAQDRKVIERSSPRTVDRMNRGEPLTINDVIKLTEGGVNDDTIIQYMEETQTTYHLSQAQIQRLENAGVSKKVIAHMIDTGR